MATIWDLKANPWTDEPRFYRPGQHPATRQMREQLRHAQQLRQRTLNLHESERPLRFRLPEMALEPGTRPAPDTKDVDEFIAYLEDELAAFEARESEVKADLASMLASRH